MLAEFGRRASVICPKHDPEKWKPVFRKIMLKQKDSAGARFNSVESGPKAKPVCATMPQ
jgi:hypothetical protein